VARWVMLQCRWLFALMIAGVGLALFWGEAQARAVVVVVTNSRTSSEIRLIDTLRHYHVRLITDRAEPGNMQGIVGVSVAREADTIAYIQGLSIRVLNASTGEQRLIDDGSFFRLALSPDGRFLAYSRPSPSQSPVTIVDLQDNTVEMTLPDYPNLMSWSPDGAYLALTLPASNSIQIITREQTTPDTVELTELTSIVTNVPMNIITWTPDSQSVIIWSSTSTYQYVVADGSFLFLEHCQGDQRHRIIPATVFQVGDL